MLQRMRVVLGFALMVMGALGTLAGPVQSKQRTETPSNRPLAPRSASARYRPGGELAAGLCIGVSEPAGPPPGGGGPRRAPGPWGGGGRGDRPAPTPPPGPPPPRVP